MVGDSGWGEVVSYLESTANGSKTVELENSLRGFAAIKELGFVDLLVSLL